MDSISECMCDPATSVEDYEKSMEVCRSDCKGLFKLSRGLQREVARDPSDKRKQLARFIINREVSRVSASCKALCTQEKALIQVKEREKATTTRDSILISGVKATMAIASFFLLPTTLECLRSSLIFVKSWLFNQENPDSEGSMDISSVKVAIALLFALLLTQLTTRCDKRLSLWKNLSSDQSGSIDKVYALLVNMHNTIIDRIDHNNDLSIEQRVYDLSGKILFYNNPASDHTLYNAIRSGRVTHPTRKTEDMLQEMLLVTLSAHSFLPSIKSLSAYFLTITHSLLSMEAFLSLLGCQWENHKNESILFILFLLDAIFATAFFLQTFANNNQSRYQIEKNTDFNRLPIKEILLYDSESQFYMVNRLLLQHIFNQGDASFNFSEEALNDLEPVVRKFYSRCSFAYKTFLKIKTSCTPGNSRRTPRSNFSDDEEEITPRAPQITKRLEAAHLFSTTSKTNTSPPTSGTQIIRRANVINVTTCIPTSLLRRSQNSSPTFTLARSSTLSGPLLSSDDSDNDNILGNTLESVANLMCSNPRGRIVIHEEESHSAAGRTVASDSVPTVAHCSVASVTNKPTARKEQGKAPVNSRPVRRSRRRLVK